MEIESGWMKNPVDLDLLRSRWRQVPAGDVPRGTSESDAEALRAAAREMEALFIAQLWKAMRKTVPRSDLLPRTLADEIFEEMLDDEFSRRMAEAGGLGLAAALERQLVLGGTGTSRQPREGAGEEGAGEK
ncbi:MAG: rod-binding protein [Bacillota bacterium]|nr:rod-binding protein [Bacillota bacterium]